MQEILNKFENYMLEKRLSLSTCKCYSNDTKDFLAYLRFKKLIDSNNISNINSIDSSAYNNFLNSLKNKNFSMSLIERKVSALKMFALFLSQKYKLPNYYDSIALPDLSLPIFFNKSTISKIFKYLENQEFSYKNLRSFILVYCLYKFKLNITTVINLNLSDICYLTNSLRIRSNKSSKLVHLSDDFIEILKKYISLIPYNSKYLFPKKFGVNILPISSHTVYSIIRSCAYLADKSKSNNFCFKINSSEKVEIEVLSNYKKSHPRY